MIFFKSLTIILLERQRNDLLHNSSLSSDFLSDKYEIGRIENITPNQPGLYGNGSCRTLCFICIFCPKIQAEQSSLEALQKWHLYKIKLHGFLHRLAEDMFVNPSMILLEEMDQICMAGNFPPLMRRFFH